jgi:hypothetical protein
MDTYEDDSGTRETPFIPSVNVDELLDQLPTDAKNDEARSVGEQRLHLVETYIQDERKNNHILDTDGSLDFDAKLNNSIYEILNQDYYRLNIHDLQGIEMPAYGSNEELREFYVLQTQRLMDKIIDDEIDVVYFLDKSARPVSWFIRELWPLFVDKDKHHLPEMKFINIDANAVMGRSAVDPQRPHELEEAEFHPSPSQIDNIRDIYTITNSDGVNIPVARHPDEYKRGLIVDEVSVTGASMRLADRMLSESFPGTHFDTAHWVSANKKTQGRRGSESQIATQMPPWYSKHFVEGRGIGDPISNPFLSARVELDTLSEALRTDIQVLAADIKAGKQSVRPLIGCFETDADGNEDYARPKYRIAMFRDGKRYTVEQTHE